MQAEQDFELPDDVDKRANLSYQLAKEIVEQLKIRDIKENQNEDDGKSHYFYIDKGFDVLLFCEITTYFGYIRTTFSLSLIAFNVIRRLQLLLSEETVPEVLEPSVIYELKKRKIEILKLFNLKESEVEESIKLQTKGILEMFIANIPVFTDSSIIDSYIHSVFGFIKHVIKPSLEEHWKELGLPKDFDLITPNQLDEVRKNNLGTKRWFLGDKKQLLNITTLADDADYLRKEYQKAKTKYFQYRSSFYSLNKNASKEEWQDKWLDSRFEFFPNLNNKALDLIEEFSPFELARIHLAVIYGYSEERMKIKISESRKLKRS